MSQGGLGSRVSRRTLLRTMPMLLGVPALVLSAACRAQAPTAAPTAAPARRAPQLPATPTASGAAPQAAPATAAPAAKPAAPTAAPPQLAATSTTGNSAGTAATTGMMRPTDGTPKRGGTLRIAGGTTTSPHFDIHQGAPSTRCDTLQQPGPVEPRTASGRSIPDLAENWEVSSDG